MKKKIVLIVALLILLVLPFSSKIAPEDIPPMTINTTSMG